jgi:uncharacterized membrane protein YecN with MAPEG domain
MAMLGATTALYGGLLGLTYFGLTANVIRKRQQHRIEIGSGGVPDMERAIRIHANFAEFVPLTLGLILLAEFAGFSQWIVHLLGGGLLLVRLAHAQGLSQSSGATPGRAIGIVGTALILAAASVFAILGHFGRTF